MIYDTGPIPPELGNLSNLQKLDLRGSVFGGGLTGESGGTETAISSPCDFCRINLKLNPAVD